jgi:hypothetical protein
MGCCELLEWMAGDDSSSFARGCYCFRILEHWIAASVRMAVQRLKNGRRARDTAPALTVGVAKPARGRVKSKAARGSPPFPAAEFSIWLVAPICFRPPRPQFYRPPPPRSPSRGSPASAPLPELSLVGHRLRAASISVEIFRSAGTAHAPALSRRSPASVSLSPTLSAETSTAVLASK